MTNCKYIDKYIQYVRDNPDIHCREQKLLVDFVEKVFNEEDLLVDIDQLEKYLSYQKYFEYNLLDWEIFCFALHNCTYQQNGLLRWPYLTITVGRGAGKNGFLSFEDFSLLTPTNGVRNYDIYIFATSEEQAKASWDDVYQVLENNEEKMSKHFRWTKEIIVNKDTNSKFVFCTSSPKTKDGARPGKIDFDEYHAYENYKLIDVAKTGLGKKEYPRRTIITTDGLVRGGPLDDELDQCVQILEGKIKDNGKLPFICRLDDDKEVHDEKMWFKANPSLRIEMKTYHSMMQELRAEYLDYLQNPAANTSFMAKRMNRPPKELECAVTSWENILATNQRIDNDLFRGMPCVAGIDYMKTTDFLGAGLLYRVGDKDYWISHTWVCKNSADLSRIKAPLQDWARQGLLTFVDASEISPELPAAWLAIEAAKRNSQILRIGIDSYRYQLLSKALQKINFSADKGWENVIKLRPSDEMLNIPVITSGFVNQRFCWGDNPLMRWACNNSKTVTSPAGNITYGKIEPKSRKTDSFKAFVAAECVSDVLDIYKDKKETNINTGTYSY